MPRARGGQRGIVVRQGVTVAHGGDPWSHDEHCAGLGAEIGTHRDLPPLGPHSDFGHELDVSVGGSQAGVPVPEMQGDLQTLLEAGPVQSGDREGPGLAGEPAVLELELALAHRHVPTGSWPFARAGLWAGFVGCGCPMSSQERPLWIGTRNRWSPCE